MAEDQRLTWRKRHEFTLSAIGYIVGISNVVFFPSLAYRNGGVVFLIPYFIMVLVIGFPMMFLEISLGQFCSRGVTQCWDFSKVFSGIGISLVIATAVGCLDYNLLIAWAIYYFAATFTFYKHEHNTLPWNVCDLNASWISDFSTCRLDMGLTGNATLCAAQNCTDENGVCYNNGRPWYYTNQTLAFGNEALRPVLISADYFKHEVNRQASTPDQFGTLSPAMVGCWFGAWTIVFLCVCRGIRCIGKVVYITATVPFIILIIMIIHAASKDYSTKCLAEYMDFKFHELSKARVWIDAAIQAQFSLVGSGALVTFSAYNEFTNNTFKSTIILVAVDTGTSLLATVAVFMYLGVLSHEEQLGSCDFIKDDTLLAFLVFPYAFKTLPESPVWSALFFFMLILLGIDSMVGELETVIEGIIAFCDNQFKTRIPGIRFYICVFFFLCGLPLTSQIGLNLYHMLVAFSWYRFVNIFLISVSIGWVYGVGRFFKDVEAMIGPSPLCCQWMTIRNLFGPLWIFVIPAGSLVLLSYMLYYSESLEVWWLEMMRWLLPVGILLPIPIAAVVRIVRAPGESWKQKVQTVLRATLAWGPNLEVNRKGAGYDVRNDMDNARDQQRTAPAGQDNDGCEESNV